MRPPTIDPNHWQPTYLIIWNEIHQNNPCQFMFNVKYRPVLNIPPPPSLQYGYGEYLLSWIKLKIMGMFWENKIILNIHKTFTMRKKILSGAFLVLFGVG